MYFVIKNTSIEEKNRAYHFKSQHGKLLNAAYWETALNILSGDKYRKKCN